MSEHEITMVSSSEAENIISQYLPLFQSLNNAGIEYCCIGGLAVMIYAYLEGNDDDFLFRATEDGDIIVPEDFPNDEFIDLYVNAYAGSELDPSKIKETLLGYSPYEEEFDDDQYVNMGVVADYVNMIYTPPVDFPSIDVLHFINIFTLKNVHRQWVNVLGTDVCVASKEDIIYMKEHPFASLTGGELRQQDYIDLKILRAL